MSDPETRARVSKKRKKKLADKYRQLDTERSRGIPVLPGHDRQKSDFDVRRIDKVLLAEDEDDGEAFDYKIDYAFDEYHDQ